MLRQDPPLAMRIDDVDVPGPLAGAALHELSIPLVALAGRGLAIVASATLWRLPARAGAPYALSTAAHVFDAGVQIGDLGIAFGREGRIAWLAGMRPALQLHATADLAVIALQRPGPIDSHWRALPAQLLSSRSHAAPDGDRQGCHLLSGWPAGQAQWTGDALVARPLVCFTAPSGHGADTFTYRRIASRLDGVDIHTPPLEGVSGALLWRVLAAGDDHCALQPAGVQVSFRHGGFLRVVPIEALAGLLRTH